jgi:hypothetical protein
VYACLPVQLIEVLMAWNGQPSAEEEAELVRVQQEMGEGGEEGDQGELSPGLVEAVRQVRCSCGGAAPATLLSPPVLLLLPLLLLLVIIRTSWHTLSTR